MEATAGRHLERARHLALRARSPAAQCGSATGMAERSACVYGCFGSRWITSREPISTISPRYMTATRSDMCSTTCRSWEMNRYVRPKRRRKSIRRFSTWAWIETSSAETGSSATMRLGCSASAAAIPMRCRWPRTARAGSARRRRDPGRRPQQLATRPTAPGRRRPDRRSRAARRRSLPTRMRGLSEPKGSWKTICMRWRAAHTSRGESGEEIAAFEADLPALGSISRRMSGPWWTCRSPTRRRVPASRRPPA